MADNIHQEKSRIKRHGRFSIREAAHIVDRDPFTVLRWIWVGKLRAKKVKNCWKIWGSDLTLMKRRRHKGNENK